MKRASSLPGNIDVLLCLSSMACYTSLVSPHGRTAVWFARGEAFKVCDRRMSPWCMLTTQVPWGWHEVRRISHRSWINCPLEAPSSLAEQKIYSVLHYLTLIELVVCPSGSDNIISELRSVAPCPRWTFRKWHGKVRLILQFLFSVENFWKQTPQRQNVSNAWARYTNCYMNLSIILI